MKKVALIIVCLVLLVGCSKDDLPPIKKFHLVNVSGGFAGVNKSFERGQISWTFNEQNSTLLVEKNTEETFSGLDEGSYSYFIQTSNKQLFLHIDNAEIGGITSSEKSIVIDENIRSIGSGADGFILLLEK